MRYRNLVTDIDTTNPLRYHFYTIFFFRRAVYAGIIVMFGGAPAAQLCLSLIMAALMIAYFLIIKPFTGNLSKALTIMN